MRTNQQPFIQQPPAVRRPSFGRVALHLLFLVLAVSIALAAVVAYEHYSLQGDSTASTISLVVAGVFGLWPVKAILREFFAVEGMVLHVVHGLGGLAVIGLTFGGVVPGGTVLSHGALAPFAIMGAAQAVMHQGHPRNAQQAAALQRFATSLPEVEIFSRPGALTSPANAARAVAALNDLVDKAEALGQAELQADPGFQSALQQATARVGLSLGLDAIDRAIGTLSTNPAAATAVPQLRRRIAAARKTLGA